MGNTLFASENGTTYPKPFSGNIKFDRRNVLGRGNSTVYRGTFMGKEVAVKRILKNVSTSSTEEIAVQIRLRHPNIIQTLTAEEDIDFTYIVLEFCAGTLMDVCKGEYTGPDLPPDQVILSGIANGLEYIHSRNLVHRDIKPENIVISCNTVPVQVKLSDFGLNKAISTDQTFPLGGLKLSTLVWMAPELLKLSAESLYKLNKEGVIKGSCESDIFSAGCVFFFFVTRGIHPYGEFNYVLTNIIENKPANLEKLSKKHFASGIIRGMIAHEPSERMYLEQALQVLEPHHQFTEVTHSLNQNGVYDVICARFHPIDPVLACCTKQGILVILNSLHHSVPLSHWKIERHLPCGNCLIQTFEWNPNGTQLAAGCEDGTVYVWSYPSGQFHFQIKHYSGVDEINWNPFKQNVFASLYCKDVFLWDTRENREAEKDNPFYTLKRDVMFSQFAWISENVFAVGLYNGLIEICQLEDKGGKTTSRIVKKFTHSKVRFPLGKDHKISLIWNERIKYLASSIDESIKIWSMHSDQAVYSSDSFFHCDIFAWRPNAETDSGGGIETARKAKENLTFACGFNRLIFVWNPLEEDERKRKRLLPQKHARNVVSLSFSPDGRFLASADSNSKIVIWSTETWTPVFSGRSPPHHKVDVFSWLFSCDVTHSLVVSNGVNEIRVIENSLETMELQNH